MNWKFWETSAVESRKPRIFHLRGDDAELIARLIDEKNKQSDESKRVPYEMHIRLWSAIETRLPETREGQWMYKIDGARIAIIEELD